MSEEIQNVECQNIEYHKYYVKFPLECIIKRSLPQLSDKSLQFPEEVIQFDDEVAAYLKRNYYHIYSKLKHGDFLENSRESGNRSDGLYMVRKKGDQIEILYLTEYLDEYGSVPMEFLGLRDFIPGYCFNLICDAKCESDFHNRSFPIDISYLRRFEMKPFDRVPLRITERVGLQYICFVYHTKRILVLFPRSYHYKYDIEYYDCYDKDKIELYLDLLNDNNYYRDDHEDMALDVKTLTDYFSENHDILIAPSFNVEDNYPFEEDDDEEDDE